jgi:hypothetical protein
VARNVWLSVVAILLLLQSCFGGATRVPLRIFALSWLISIAPLVTGILVYPYLPYDTASFALTLAAYLGCFTVGALLCDLNARRIVRPPESVVAALVAREFSESLPVARLCWWIAIVGTVLLCVDFIALQGAGLEDIAALRDLYIGKSAASIYARLSSVMTWGCLYCFGFALTYRTQLKLAGVLRFLVPILGFFLISLFSAGRQAAFQIMLFTLLLLWLKGIRTPASRKVRTRGVWFALLISALMIAYMGYIAVVRNDAQISADMVEVLERIFDFNINPQFDAVVSAFGVGIRTTIIEGLLYFSSSIGLFAKFLQLSFPQHFFGVMSFPIIFRQIEPITGLSVIGSYFLKVDTLISAGVIGFGWTTGISSYILDFGTIGAGVFLLLQGYYSAHTWRRAISSFGFNDGMIAVVMAVAALYMPLFPATSDTNLLFLWVFCVLARQRTLYLARWRRKADKAVAGGAPAHGSAA